MLKPISPKIGHSIWRYATHTQKEIMQSTAAARFPSMRERNQCFNRKKIIRHRIREMATPMNHPLLSLSLHTHSRSLSAATL